MSIRTLLHLVGSIVLYYTLSYIGMSKAIELVCIRDYFKLPTVQWVGIFANIIPVMTVGYRLYRRTNINIYLLRGSYLYALKGLIQFVTIVPAVTGTNDCVERTFWGMVLYGNCADMMFSGHTGLTYLMAPDKERFLFVIPTIVFLIASEMHYTSDVIIAIIVAAWIEVVVPLPTVIDNRSTVKQLPINYF